MQMFTYAFTLLFILACSNVYIETNVYTNVKKVKEHPTKERIGKKFTIVGLLLVVMLLLATVASGLEPLTESTATITAMMC